MKFNKLIPELYVKDLDKSRFFYEKILGFKIGYERDDFIFLSLQDSQIMLQKKNNIWKTGKLEYPFGRGINFQIIINDVENIFDILKKNNYPIFEDIREKEYKTEYCLVGNKEFLVQDPDGYLLRFAQDLGSK